eukprot:scaffold98648_cov63-Phaeocystis_antarctica.AAC.1
MTGSPRPRSRDQAPISTRSGSGLDVWRKRQLPTSNGSGLRYRCCSTTLHTNFSKSEQDRADGDGALAPRRAALSSARRTVKAMASPMTSPITSPITSPPAMTLRQHKVEVAAASNTQTQRGVLIACSPMRTGERPVLSGASSFMWEAAAQHFQVAQARSCSSSARSRPSSTPSPAPTAPASRRRR